MEGWKRIINNLYVFSIIKQGYSLHGFAEVGLRSHPNVAPAPETIPMTFQHPRFDQPVCSTMGSGGCHHFYGHFYPGVGRPYGGIPDIGNMLLSRPQTLFHLSGAQGGISGPTRLVH